MFTLELLSGIWIADSNILNSKKFMDDNQITIILPEGAQTEDSLAVPAGSSTRTIVHAAVGGS